MHRAGTEAPTLRTLRVAIGTAAAALIGVTPVAPARATRGPGRGAASRTSPTRRTDREAPPVSVIIPAYRAAGTIGRAVQSVLAQSAPPREVIVVDDGSPDDLPRALAPYQDRVTLVRKPNGGAASARNLGIELARGEVVTFLDADDYWEPEKLAVQLDVLAAYPEVGVVGGGLYLEQPGAPGRRFDPALDPTLFDRVLELDGPDAFHAAGMFWTGTIAIRRDVLGAQRFDESLSTAEDRELWTRLLLAAPAYLPGQPLATCVLVEGSLSRTNIERDCRNMLAVVDRYRDLLGPDEHRRWTSEVHRKWSTRLLAAGDPRGALAPAARHLRQAPSVRAAYTLAKSAALGARAYVPRRPPPVASVPGAPAITEITDADGLAALRDEWTALHARTGNPVPALSWEWLYTWWEVFAPGRALRVLVARDGDRLIGVAPLLARTIRPRGVPIRRLELLATGEDEADEILSEYLDYLIEPGREAEVHAAFWRHLAADPSWDELCLASVPVDSPLTAALRAAIADAPVDVETRRRPDGVVIGLAADARQFVAAQAKRMREDLRRHRRMLEQHGPVTVERAETLAQLRAMFPVFVALHQALWTSRGKPGCFASPRFTAFHQQVSERMFPLGRVHLYVIKVGDRAVAARYGFHVGDRLYEYQSGVDPTFDPRISTGLQAAQLCMEEAIARGFTSYDLGEGPRPYKLRWNHTRRATENVWVTRRNPRTLARALVTAAEEQVRAYRRARAGEPAGAASDDDDGAPA